jgi:ribonuclease HII
MVTIKRKPNFKKNFYEQNMWLEKKLVCGIDEVGRGCLAGPVVTAAVMLNLQKTSRLIKDSKLLVAEERLKAYTWLQKNSVFAIGILNHRVIDQLNIYHATAAAMKRAVMQLMSKVDQKPSIILVDALPLKLESFKGDVVAFPFGESKSISIAAASIVAKVTRDKIMGQLSSVFPGYEFGKHKGYCTKEHVERLKELQKSLIHRKTFLNNLKKISDTQINIFEENDELIILEN